MLSECFDVHRQLESSEDRFELRSLGHGPAADAFSNNLFNELVNSNMQQRMSEPHSFNICTTTTTGQKAICRSKGSGNGRHMYRYVTEGNQSALGSVALNLERARVRV